MNGTENPFEADESYSTSSATSNIPSSKASEMTQRNTIPVFNATTTTYDTSYYTNSITDFEEHSVRSTTETKADNYISSQKNTNMEKTTNSIFETSSIESIPSFPTFNSSNGYDSVSAISNLNPLITASSADDVYISSSTSSNIFDFTSQSSERTRLKSTSSPEG